MDELHTRRILVEGLGRIRRLGYQYNEGEDPRLVEFDKVVSVEVRCIIRFDILEYPQAVSELKVYLVRRRLSAFPAEQVTYKPLFIDLPNLLKFYYRFDPLFDNATGWEFTNYIELANQIEKLQKLIVDYGIKWLEDPTSDIEWVKHPRRARPPS